MNEKTRLLEEFPVPSLEEWRAEVERLLRGAPFEKKMFTCTLEGLRAGSMATAADVPANGWSDTLPGQAPFLRGAGADGRTDNGWLVAQEIPLADAASFNTALLKDLESGQTGVNLILSGAQAQGTEISGLDDLRTALQGVDLSAVPVLIQAGVDHGNVAENLLALAVEYGVDLKDLRGRVGCDPVAGIALEGSLPVSVEKLYDELAKLSARKTAATPGLRSLPVFEDPWHQGGADGALGLGLTLAAAVTALREMESRGVALEVAARQVHFNLCIGSDFFMEMARLRALRILWTRILVACEVDPSAAPIMIHARTSSRTATVLDSHVNMLRATTQAMSAVLGGVDSLHVAPFDEISGTGGEFSRRIARNVQLILARECHLDHVVDPAGGSWYVEKLTADLATRTWEIFQDVEKTGGILKGLAEGRVQDRVAAAALERAQRLATRRDVMVGTNQYPDPHPLQGDPVEAAVPDDASIPLRRDGLPFEVLRARIENLGRKDAPAGRVFCACLGDVSRYMPRLEFTRRFFRVGGFVISGDDFFETAGEAVAAALADGARTVVLVGLDGTYAQLAGPVAAGLKEGPEPPVVMLAGMPIEGAGVDETINVKSDVLDVLGRLADKVGGVS